MTTVGALNEERARLVRHLRALYAARDRGEDWDHGEEIRLTRAITAIEAQIQELGGSIEPVSRDDDPEPPSGGSGDGEEGSEQEGGDRPAGATTHLGVPPDAIDQTWNELVDRYEKAQQDVADHALSERDDWTCSHGDPSAHGGCAIWWRGELEHLLSHLRDRANQLLDDLAGPRTQQEFQDDAEMLRVRERDLGPLDERIRIAEKRLQELLDQFTEDEKTYKALRDAGGDVGPYTGVFSAARSRLLADIAAVQQELTRLYAERTAVLTRLRDLEKRAGSVRRDRGLDRAEDRWPDLFLDLDSLTDEELLRRLLGDEQYERMQKERRRQGTQMRRKLLRRTSLGVSPAAVVVVAVLVLLVGVVSAVTTLGGDSGGDSDEGEAALTVDAIDAPATDDAVIGDPVETGDAGEVPAVVIECVLVTELDLEEIIIEPGSHHQGNVAVRVTDADGEPVDGVEVAIETDKSDGTQTEAVGATQDGTVIFGMITTDYGPNTLIVTDVASPGCTWSPDGATTLTWDAEP